MRAPVAAGQKVGTVEIYEGEQLVGKIDAITKGAIPEGGLLSIIGMSDQTAVMVERIFSAVLLLFIALAAAYVVLKRRQLRRRKLRRQERASRYLKSNRQRYDDHWRY